ncbi:MAG: anaerobic glycerol-3-phosphate dehydrogenase subunit GlpB [Firmicutes bacterium]|nr:anaerobic glycerol-3-phosphate dehydrogenase subunit GlpB [Bacillota bacterium]
MTYDVVVIGGGLAGLVAANVAARRGKGVLLIAEGLASLHMATGCIDLLGYAEPGDAMPVIRPWEALEELSAQAPCHPYAKVGRPLVAESLEWFAGLCREGGCPLAGSTGGENLLLPTGLGTVRPTYLAPETMISGNLADLSGNTGDSGDLLIVGFEGFRDFYPAYVAENLNLAGERYGAHPGWISNWPHAAGVQIGVPDSTNMRDLSAVDLAVRFEREEFRRKVAEKIKEVLARLTCGAEVARVGFPAVLGLEKAVEARHDLEEKLGLRVFEIPILPPSVPGLRLAGVLEKAARAAGVEVLLGSPVVGAEVENGRCRSVTVRTPVRENRYQAEAFVLATGGVLGGGIRVDLDGPREPIFGLPVGHPPAREDWSRPQLMAPEGHAFLRFGVEVDGGLRPLGRDGAVAIENLLAAGSLLAGHGSCNEQSAEGIAIATGYAAGRWC